jgi:hypothetical protein
MVEFNKVSDDLHGNFDFMEKVVSHSGHVLCFANPNL